MPPGARPSQSGFTMVEIAICLAIVAFAMVAIMGVLPFGMQVQKENREDTIINYEGSYYLEAIRNGALALNDLTNYVEWISIVSSNRSKYYTNRYTNLTPYQIVGLLSTPRTAMRGDEFMTNKVLAKIRAMGGSAADKIPVNAKYDPAIGNLATAIRDLSFSYILEPEITPFLLGPGELTSTNGLDAVQMAGVSNRLQLAHQMIANSYEVKLTMRWPLRPRDLPGNSSQTFRTLIGGALTMTNVTVNSTTGRKATDLFFFQPSTFQRVRP